MNIENHKIEKNKTMYYRHHSVDSEFRIIFEKNKKSNWEKQNYDGDKENNQLIMNTNYSLKKCEKFQNLQHIQENYEKNNKVYPMIELENLTKLNSPEERIICIKDEIKKSEEKYSDKIKKRNSDEFEEKDLLANSITIKKINKDGDNSNHQSIKIKNSIIGKELDIEMGEFKKEYSDKEEEENIENQFHNQKLEDKNRKLYLLNEEESKENKEEMERVKQKNLKEEMQKKILKQANKKRQFYKVCKFSDVMKYVYIEMVSFIKTNIQNKDNHNDNQNNCILYNKSDELIKEVKEETVKIIIQNEDL